MAAILRVKRKKEDEPLDALLIACKRQKTNDSEAETASPLTAVVKFAGTVEKQEDNVIEHISKTLSADELKANYKQHIVDISKKNREIIKQGSSENRYKIVNSFRSLNHSQSENIDDDIVNIIDVEDAKSCSGSSKDIEKKDDAYVYDLYYTTMKEEIDIDRLVSVRPFEQELVFEDYKEGYDNEFLDESEDSNSESNWRNDYPDESEHSDESITERDMNRAVEKLGIDDELSSDEDFVYSLDQSDVDNYGYKYAKYKARMKKEDQESDDGRKSSGDENYSDDEHSNYEDDS